MPFSVRVHHGRPYLVVEVEGLCSLADLCGTADLAATVALRSGYRRVLFDLMKLDLALSFTEHLQLGTHVAQRLAPLDRVASVTVPANRTGTSEKAAQKLGLELRTFSDMAEALAWLERS